jgi:hypothetical protein
MSVSMGAAVVIVLFDTIGVVRISMESQEQISSRRIEFRQERMM